MKKILISGFQPFLDQAENPSERLALELAQIFPELNCVILPVEYGTAFLKLKQKIAEVQPTLVLMLGQARNRQRICLEKVALNWIYSEYADEKNNNPGPGPIIPNKELALMSSFPVEKWAREFSDLEVSFSAGTFVCNELYYRVLESYPDLMSVFIHLPMLPEQIPLADIAGLSLSYGEQLRILTDLVHGLRGN